MLAIGDFLELGFEHMALLLNSLNREVVMLLDTGSLHWALVGADACRALYRLAVPLLLLIGVALLIGVVGLIARELDRNDTHRSPAGVPGLHLEKGTAV